MRFAFVTPRYGADVPGGAEHVCRLIAEQVGRRHDVEVLTTCARDPRAWKNDYSEGVDRVRGALVRRFAVSQGNDAPPPQPSDRALIGPPVRAEELDWIRRSGPWSPGLLEHLKRQHRSYDAVVFFSVWNPLTIHGLSIAPERSVLVPHLHLQPALRFGIVAEALAAAGAVGYISAAERRLLRSYVRVTPRYEEIVGIGIDPSPEQSYPKHQQNPADTVSQADEDEEPEADEAEEVAWLAGRGIPFRRRHRLYGSFALYGGRVEPDNGSEELLEYFDTYASGDGDTVLVLMGVKMMRVPEERYVRLAGVLPERERMIAYEAADVTIAPASDDLTAQPVLESFAVGTPVLACARNDAAVEHCRRSNAGLYYANRDEFVEALRLLTTSSRVRERLAANGRSYITQHYRWDAVLGRFDRLVSRVRGR